jgi:hypothetical protein
LIKGSAKATQANIDEALTRSLSIKDEEGRARDPLVILRVMHDGRQVAAPRIYPDTAKGKVFDQTLGDYKEVSIKVDAAATIQKVMSGAPGRNEFETRQLDTARAVIAGIKDLDEPNFVSADPNLRGVLRNLYYGAQQGALHVQVIAAEKIDFGAKSRQTYLTDKDRAHLAAYQIHEEQGDQLKQWPAYTETVLAVLRYPDGEPYAVFASPEEMYPRMTKLANLPTQVGPRMELASDPIQAADSVNSALRGAVGEEPQSLEEEPALVDDVDDDDPVPY